MRRGLSILLALVFGLGPLTAALPGMEDALLPPCCRRNGVHHCEMAAHMLAMMAPMATDGSQSVSAPTTCPYYPGPTVAILMPAAHALAALPAIVPALRSVPAVPTPLLVPAFSAPSHAYAGRGPPDSIQS